jgi:hypothetical protein
MLRFVLKNSRLISQTPLFDSLTPGTYNLFFGILKRESQPFHVSSQLLIIQKQRV